MRINGISFKGVTPVISYSSATEERLRNHLSKERVGGCVIQNATHLYAAKCGHDKLTCAAKEGNEIILLVTGEDCLKMAFMENGWNTEKGPSNHISKDVVEIKSRADEKDAFKKLVSQVREDLPELDP